MNNNPDVPEETRIAQDEICDRSACEFMLPGPLDLRCERQRIIESLAQKR